MDETAVYVPQLLETQIVGAPHYGVQKFDRTTGEKHWESEQVKEMNALQDLTILDDRLLGRAVHLGGGALGSDPRQRLVGWNLETGSITWNRKTPYEFSNAAMIRVGPLGGDSPRAWNLVTNDDRAYVATDTSVTAYDTGNGTVEASASAEVPGQPVWITRGGNSLVDLRSEGVSFHALSDLSSAAEPITFASEVITYERAENYLLVRTEKALYAVNVAQQTLAGTVAQEDGGGLVTGSLRDGFFVTEGGRSLFVLTPERIVQKYSLP
jgi:outer membrane protein assembly factor BamB